MLKEGFLTTEQLQTASNMLTGATGADRAVYEESVDPNSFLLFNKRSGECIEQVKEGRGGDDWDAYISKGCDVTKQNQRIRLQEEGGQISLASGDDNFFVTTGRLLWDYAPDVRALWSGDRSGSYSGGDQSMNQHGLFNITGVGANSGKTGKDALVNGPVKIGSAHYTKARFHMEDANGWQGERLRNFDNDDAGVGLDAQTFIHYGLLKKCKDRGISLDNCTATRLKDCGKVENHNVTDCPNQYCTKPENVSKEECRTVCNTQDGLCDQAASDYCSVDGNKDKAFCSCFGAYPPSETQRDMQAQGFVLRRTCNLPECVNNSSSYRTRDMKQQACPSMTVCIQGIETGTIGGSASFKNVTFNCARPPGSESPLPPYSASNEDTNTSAAEKLQKKNKAKAEDDGEEEDEDEKTRQVNLQMAGIGVAALVILLLIIKLLLG